MRCHADRADQPAIGCDAIVERGGKRLLRRPAIIDRQHAAAARCAQMRRQPAIRRGRSGGEAAAVDVEQRARLVADTPAAVTHSPRGSPGLSGDATVPGGIGQILWNSGSQRARRSSNEPAVGGCWASAFLISAISAFITSPPANDCRGMLAQSATRREPGREPMKLAGGWLARVRYAPIPTKFYSAAK